MNEEKRRRYRTRATFETLLEEACDVMKKCGKDTYGEMTLRGFYNSRGCYVCMNDEVRLVSISWNDKKKREELDFLPNP